MRGRNQNLTGLGNPVSKTNPEGWPVSAIRMFAGTLALPAGWLECDGSELNRTEYSDLFEAIGIAFGTPSEVTKFVLPDFRGRTALGIDGSIADLSLYTGAETVTLDASQGGIHNHPTLPTLAAVYNYSPAAPTNTIVTVAATGTELTTSISTSTQTAGPHNNMQPWLVVRFAIRT